MRASLRLNLLANSAGQLYNVLIGIFMLPVFYQQDVLGPASVGVIGFYTMLMVWFNLLDLGLTPTINRETTRFLAGHTDSSHYLSILWPLLAFFSALTLLATSLLWWQLPEQARAWVEQTSLAQADFNLVLQLMALTLGLRLFGAILRGLLNGAEVLLWLNGMNTLVVTIRFVLVLPLMAWFGYSLVVFFAVQLVAALLEFGLLVRKSWRVLQPQIGSWQFSWRPLKSSLGFSVNATLLSLLGVALSQTDKLLLYASLPLSESGELTLAVSLSGGILLLGTMFGGALLPRLTSLYHQGSAVFVDLYLKSSQWVAVLVLPATLVVALAGPNLLLAWTGESAHSASLSQLVCWYALGSGLMVMNAFAYYLQFAAGSLRYHLISQSVAMLLWVSFLLCWLPELGAIGAAQGILVLQVLQLLIYVPLVHRRYLPGWHWRWLTGSVLQIVLPVLVLNILLQQFLPVAEYRWQALLWVMVQAGLSLLTAICCVPTLRAQVIALMRKWL